MNKRNKREFELTFSYLKNHKRELARSLWWYSLNELIPMQVPILTGLIVDGLSSNHTSFMHITFSGAESVLTFSIVCMFVLALLLGISSYSCTVSIAKLSRSFVSDIRKKLILKIAYLSLEMHHRFGPGDLLGITLQDTSATRKFMEKIFVKTFTTLLRAGYPMVMLCLINVRLAAIAFSVLIPQRLISGYLEKRLHRGAQKTRKTSSDLISVVKENIDGVEAIQSVNGYDQAIGKAFDITEKVEKSTLYTNRISAMIKANVWFLTSVGVGLIWWQGGLMVMRGEMTLGTLVVFTSFAAIVYTPFRRFTNIVKTYRAGLVSLERIQELLETHSTIVEQKNARPMIIDEDAAIEFHNVYFTYISKEVLTNINLRVQPKRLIAIVGPSGSGKSTLMKLIGRLYDPTAGQIVINGQCLKTVTLDSIRAQIAIVPQRPVLFSGTIIENLRMANSRATMEEIRDACEKASALDFIEGLENGFDTMMGAKGVALSGGEVQRISIARAILRSPKILLLDEPTSSLDTDADSIIMHTLLRLSSHMTVILTSHHARSVQHAHQIVVMRKGHIVDIGIHDELIKKSGIYREYFLEMPFDNYEENGKNLLSGEKKSLNAEKYHECV